jgi:hypothetical protein
VKVSQRKAQQQAALTDEAREIYAAAVAGSSSVFVDAPDHDGDLVPATAGATEAPALEDLPLAARLPRAMSGPVAPSAVDNATASEAITNAGPPTRVDRERARPNPRPAPRRTRARRTREALAGESIVENNE